VTNPEKSRTYYGGAPPINSGFEIVGFEDTRQSLQVAGALGWPVWIMLPFAAEWRWMRDHADPPPEG
jgi:hypothetical protein